MTDSTFELFGPLATAIRDLLFYEWDPSNVNDKLEFIDAYNDYIPAIHRLVRERHSSNDAEEIEEIAAYLNFVVRNYIGDMPNKELNTQVATKLFTMVEAARRSPAQLTEIMTEILNGNRIAENVE